MMVTLQLLLKWRGAFSQSRSNLWGNKGEIKEKTISQAEGRRWQGAKEKMEGLLNLLQN